MIRSQLLRFEFIANFLLKPNKNRWQIRNLLSRHVLQKVSVSEMIKKQTDMSVFYDFRNVYFLEDTEISKICL